ncbi:MAG: DUF3592 domain-containing protein [Peptococcaceae bacterium]|nr:MAG: DUF3592 domain-containing protein [Peptococcaceae bacterium]
MSIGKVLNRQLIFLLLIPLAGIFLLLWGGRIIYLSVISTDWPQTEGIVISSGVEKYDSGLLNKEEGPSYGARVVYKYTVAQIPYTGSIISFSDYNSGSPRHPLEVIKQYPPGRRVTVHYSPQNPGLSVLETGVTWKSFIVFIIGLIFIATGTLFVLLEYYKKAPN